MSLISGKTHEPSIKVVQGTNIASVGMELFEVDDKLWLVVDRSGSKTQVWFVTEDVLERWLSDCVKSGNYVISVLDGNYDVNVTLR